MSHLVKNLVKCMISKPKTIIFSPKIAFSYLILIPTTTHTLYFSIGNNLEIVLSAGSLISYLSYYQAQRSISPIIPQTQWVHSSHPKHSQPVVPTAGALFPGDTEHLLFLFSTVAAVS